MPFQNPNELKEFLAAQQYICEEKNCPFKTDDEQVFSQHMIEHVLLKAQDRKMKIDVAQAKPKKALVNMLGKLIK